MHGRAVTSGVRVPGPISVAPIHHSGRRGAVRCGRELRTTPSAGFQSCGVEGTGSAPRRGRGPPFETRQLVLRLAGEQVDEAALDALALEEGVVDLLGDGHLDAQPLGQRRAPRRPCRRPRPRRAESASISAHVRPAASSTPRRWLRDSGEQQVAMTSPMPARPAKVSGLAPAATPRRVISARPRVMMPALPLSPKPSRSAAPAAMATMFLSAPHSSTPMTSRLR